MQKVFHDGSLSLSLLPIDKTVASQRVSTHLKTLQSSPFSPFVLDPHGGQLYSKTLSGRKRWTVHVATGTTKPSLSPSIGRCDDDQEDEDDGDDEDDDAEDGAEDGEDDGKVK